MTRAGSSASCASASTQAALLLARYHTLHVASHQLPAKDLANPAPPPPQRLCARAGGLCVVRAGRRPSRTHAHHIRSCARAARRRRDRGAVRTPSVAPLRTTSIAMSTNLPPCTVRSSWTGERRSLHSSRVTAATDLGEATVTMAGKWLATAPTASEHAKTTDPREWNRQRQRLRTRRTVPAQHWRLG